MRVRALKLLVEKGHPHYGLASTWARGDTSRIGTLCDTLQFDKQGYHIDWHGNYCGKPEEADIALGRHPEDILKRKGRENINYLQCNTHYPLVRIRQLLENGARKFPKAQFEKVSPVERVWFGFEYQCKGGWKTETASKVDLYGICNGKVFNKNGGEKCARNSQKEMMMCFGKHLTGECKSNFIPKILGVDGVNLDLDESGENTVVWETAIKLLYNTGEGGVCSLLNPSSEVSKSVNIFFCNKNRWLENVPQ